MLFRSSQILPTHHPLHRIDWGNPSSCMPSSIWPRYSNTLGLFAQKLKRSSNVRAGPKRPWIKCIRSTVSSRSRSESLSWEKVSVAPSCVCFTLTETVVMMRVVRKDYTFADGTRIPQGTTVSVNPTQAHHEPEMYETPEQFEDFRFAKMRLQQESKKYDIVAHVLLAFRIRASCLCWTLLCSLQAQDHARAHRSQLRREDGE